MMVYQYTCTICGTAFVRANKKATVCSRDCFREFTSRLHGGKIMREETRAKLSATKRERGALKPTLTKVCIHCGASFAISRYRNREQREQAKFCGRECQFAYWRVHPRKPKPTMPPIERACKHCGVTFLPPRAELGAKTAAARQFCSKAHMHAYRREHPEWSPLWRGGRDPYYGPNWRYQARLARERDDHTCQDCGKQQHTPALDVHHIGPRRLFGGDHVAANELANLITLCKSCHSTRGSGRPRVSTEQRADSL